jgi:hypothetical protein
MAAAILNLDRLCIYDILNVYFAWHRSHPAEFSKSKRGSPATDNLALASIRSKRLGYGMMM